MNTSMKKLGIALALALAVASIIAEPAAYGIHLKPIANRPYFAAVDTGSQIDLAEAAKLADITVPNMYRLNPGFNRWATDPRGPFELLVPVGQAREFTKNLGEQARDRRLDWQRYSVAPGDSLSLIAKRFDTTVDALTRHNQLSGASIQTGQTLLIPVLRANSAQQQSLLRSKQIAKRGSQRIDYRVRRGDSMWSIARKFDVSVLQITEWNELSAAGTLHAGSTLKLWTQAQAATQSTTGASAASSKSSDSPMPAPYIQKVPYTVKRGDTLSQIATTFKVNVKDLLEWNPLEQSDILHPGQRLTLFVDITNVN